MEKEEIINGSLDFYRIKTEWTRERENGELAKVKTEELVMATSYTEAEKVAYAIVEDQQRAKYGSVNIEIIKTKISDVLFNDILVQDNQTVCGLICNFFEESEESGVDLDSVRIIKYKHDEKSGKTKRSTQTFFVPATSNTDATKRVEAELNRTMSDYVIRDTKFDKAEAIYWPADVHQNKVNASDLQ